VIVSDSPIVSFLASFLNCFLMGQTFRLLQRYQHLFTDLLKIEKDFPNIAYWVNDNTFI